jgi:hypothetical protein
MAGLPSILVPGLDLVLCGTAVGTQSATRGHYYAGRGNQFWRLLHETALTPSLLTPDDDLTLPEYGIGLTDLAPGITQSHDRGLRYDTAALLTAMSRFAPRSRIHQCDRWPRCCPGLPVSQARTRSAAVDRRTVGRVGAPQQQPRQCRYSLRDQTHGLARARRLRACLKSSAVPPGVHPHRVVAAGGDDVLAVRCDFRRVAYAAAGATWAPRP